MPLTVKQVLGVLSACFALMLVGWPKVAAVVALILMGACLVALVITAVMPRIDLSDDRPRGNP